MHIYKLSVVMIMMLALSSCDVKQKKETELPEVDVDLAVEAGQLPDFEIDWADVKVGTKTKTVEIPKVVIVMEEEEVDIPYLDIDMPQNDQDRNSENTKVEQNIMVEAEVTGLEHELEIKEIRATGSTLYVISSLEETDKTIGDKKLRVSDQVSINAPELSVKHFIVGKRPNRVFNSRYKYFDSLDEATEAIEDTKVIYSNS